MNKNRLLELAGIEIKGVKNDNEKDKLVSILRKNVNPSEEDLKDFDKSFIASMLANLLKKYKHVDDADEKFDAEQLAKGVKVEHEHTDDSYLAKIIAKAHLSEISDYYTRLEKMEKEGKENASSDA